MKICTFSDSEIRSAPERPGIYYLYDNREVLFIGMAKGGSTNLRSSLIEHKNGHHGSGTQRSTHFSYEENSNPEHKHREALEDHTRKNGRAPRFQK